MSSKDSSCSGKMNGFDFDFKNCEDFDINMICMDRMADTSAGSDPFGEINFEKIFDLIEWNKVFHKTRQDSASGDSGDSSEAFVKNLNGEDTLQKDITWITQSVNKISSSGSRFKSTLTPSGISQMLQDTGDII